MVLQSTYRSCQICWVASASVEVLLPAAAVVTHHQPSAGRGSEVADCWEASAAADCSSVGWSAGLAWLGVVLYLLGRAPMVSAHTVWVELGL